MCVFCRSDLGRDGVEALLCGHTFHSTCIEQYMSATGRSRVSCCPYKCAQSQLFAVAGAHPPGDDAADDDQRAASFQLPVVTVDPEEAILAERVAANAMEMIQ
jgi:dissimilatory sulfite reductase (desulfoviridin) alpha/beta subunit